MGKCKVLLFVFAVVLLLAAAQGAFARDYFYSTPYWTAPWTRGDNGTTYQAWEFTHNPGPTPTFFDNPNGVPQLNVTNGTYPYSVIGPDGGTEPINALHIGEGGGEISIFVPNTPVPNWTKYIYLQITSDKALNGMPSTIPGGTATPDRIIGYPNSNWYTYTYMLTIHPNPESETIFIPFYENTNIEEIVVDTICTVPEPTSIAALGAGLLGLLGIRRRRQ